MSKLRSAVAGVSGVLLIAVVLAACGGSSSETVSGREPASSDSSAGSTSTAASNEPTGSPLRIGLLANVTGALPTGEENAVPVAEAWAKAVNAEGGVAGHPVEIVVFDTKGEPSAATAAAKKIAGEESIVAAVLFDGATEELIAGEITKAHLPVVGGMGYTPNAWGKLPNWLPLTTSIPSIFNMGMVLGKHLGGTRTALTICAEVAPCEAAAPIVENASEKLGMEYVGTYKIASAEPSYTAQCLQMIEKGVNYAMLGAATTEAALRLAKDCATQGYKGKWGLYGGVIFPKVMRESDPGVPLNLVMNSFPWFAEAPPVQEYKEMMEAEGVSEEVWGDLHATAAYATLKLFGKTLDEAAGWLPAEPTRGDVIKAYGGVKNETLEGLLPEPITFHPNKPNAEVTCYWFGKYENGTFSEGNLEKPVCDPPVLAG